MIVEEQQLARLMQLAQSGDRRAYAALLEQCERWLRRFFVRRIPPSALDDLVQDTLMSVHRKRDSYDPQRPFLPWLAAIARYRWVDHLRKVYRADETELPAEISVDPQAEEVVAKVSIDRLLGHLPDRQASAIRLVKIDGLSIEESSAQMGQTPSWVKVNIHRGFKKLSALIERV